MLIGSHSFIWGSQLSFPAHFESLVPVKCMWGLVLLGLLLQDHLLLTFGMK